MQPEEPEPRPLHVDLLLALRQRRRWSQSQLAHQLGLSLSTIANWESGRHDPHPIWIATLHDLLKATSTSEAS